jgi:cytochrome c
MIARRIATTALLASALVTTAHAEGDAQRGLHGIFSRKAGELSDFRYSPAMKRSGVGWTPESLDKYIADPQAFIPANRMPYAGMSNASDRADLIAYLQKATQ